MLAGKLNWGTVPDWFTVVALFLAVYGLVNERNKDRRFARMARLGRARRVAVHYELIGEWKVVEGERFLVKPKITYTITNNGESPIFAPRVCAWHGDMAGGIANTRPSLVWRLGSGKSISGELPWIEEHVREEDVRDCFAEVVFEDLDFYTWRYDPILGTIEEKPFDSPEITGLQRWRYALTKWRRRIRKLQDRLQHDN
jgi:hypothetical protein